MSRFQVRWATPAAKDLEHFDRDTQERIIRAVEHFAETGQGNVRKLQGRRDEWALRIGRVRVLYGVAGTVLHVRAVRHRREAYR